MNLLTEILNKELKTVSIVGMAKNAGKTATLNHLIQLGGCKQVALGLTSIGRDGEEEDVVTNTDKPRIHIPANTLLGIAKDLLQKSRLNFEIIERTEFNTPLGEIIIVRSQEAGFVQISGPSTKQQLQQVKEKLLALGADLVLIDGALNRKSLAAPTLTEGTILATGAVIGEQLSTIVDKTAFQIELFNLSTSDDETLQQLAGEVSKKNKVTIIEEQDDGQQYKPVIPDVKTAINNLTKITEQITQATKAVVFEGALVDSIVKKLMAKVDNLDQIELIVNDATHIFLSRRLYNRFKSLGGNLKVKQEVDLVGVTVNPFSPVGSSLNPVDLLTEIGKLARPIPVYEIKLGKMYGQKGVKDIEVFTANH